MVVDGVCWDRDDHPQSLCATFRRAQWNCDSQLLPRLGRCGKVHNFAGPFKQLAECQRVWYIDATAHTSDWKRNAGVNMFMNRKEVRPSFSRPPKVQCNLDLPTLKAGKTTLYFFPDRLLINDAVALALLHTQT